MLLFVRMSVAKNRSKLQNFLEYQRALSTMPSIDIKKLETMKTGREEGERKLQEAERTSSALFPWAEDVFGDEEWTFQQDGAPAHKAIETQDFLRDNCPDVITVDPHWRNPTGEWSPNSPDLNPLDYSVWSILEEKACRSLTRMWNP